MRHFKYLIAFVLVAILCLSPLIAISQIDKTSIERNSNTLEIMKSSPSSFELNNSTALFTGGINTVTPKGKEFAAKHSSLAQETITEINILKHKLSGTRELNKEYMNGLAIQLSLWKELAQNDPSLKPILSRELQVFNTGMDLQMQENIRWVLIDSTIEEIKKLDDKDYTPANESFTKSNLYTNLLLYYVDLIDFYKGKYKDLITLSTLNHATQENPQLNLRDDILAKIKPLHARELKSAEILIFDLDENFKKLKDISDKARELDSFYNDMNHYSISELDNIIKNLKETSLSLKTNNYNMVANADMEPIIDDYIELFEGFKKDLEDQVLAYEIKEATYIAMAKENSTKVAYTGIIHPGYHYTGISDWASNAWSAVKTGTKVVTGATFAAADYVTGKAADTIFEVTDKASAAWDKGVFSDEYAQWSSAYDKAGENNSTVSIKSTFVDPLKATLRGDDKQGIGQSAVNKAQQSFQSFDKNVIGENIISQAAMNAVTVGGYGLAKDMVTLNDANASTTDKIVAGAGVILALAPVASGARGARGAKTGVKAFNNSRNIATNNIKNALANQTGASKNLITAVDNLADATKNMIKAAGPNMKNADEVANGIFRNMAQNFDDAVIKKVGAQTAYNQATNQVNNAIKQGIKDVPIKTITKTVKNTIKGFVGDHSLQNIGNRFRDLYSNSLTQAIKNAEPLIKTTIKDGIGVKDIANFTLNNFINNNVTGSITSGLKNLLNSGSADNVPSQNGPSAQDPGQANSGQNQPPLVPQLPQISGQMPLVPIVPQQPQTGNYPPGSYPPGSYGPYPMPPYNPYGPGSYPPQTDPNLLSQYLSQLGLGNQDSGQTPVDPNLFNQVIQNLQQNQQTFDDSRGVGQNQNNYVTQNSQTYNTDPTAGQQGGSTGNRIQGLSQQTQQMVGPKPSPPSIPPPTPTKPPVASTPPSSIPIGDGIPETNRTNGIDDDNDGVIDEGPASGNCQIAIHDTGGDKDDMWELKVDGSSIGRNSEGKTRFWDLNLSKGTHSVSATGVKIPDNVGTYTIWFGTCSKASGPSMTGNNLNQGTTFNWTINVP